DIDRGALGNDTELFPSRGARDGTGVAVFGVGHLAADVHLVGLRHRDLLAPRHAHPGVERPDLQVCSHPAGTSHSTFRPAPAWPLYSTDNQRQRSCAAEMRSRALSASQNSILSNELARSLPVSSSTFLIL